MTYNSSSGVIFAFMINETGPAVFRFPAPYSLFLINNVDLRLPVFPF